MSEPTRMENWSGARAGTPARAAVFAGGVDTPYVRAGRGDPIVLLASDMESIEVQHAVDVLARNFLVIAASPANATEPDAWLRDFLEGLGVAGASILVHASLAHKLTIGDSNDA